MNSYDVIIIGSGPGGYVAAIRCAQLGLKTALVEKYATLGGTCLNVGCIPSKSLLASAHQFHNLSVASVKNPEVLQGITPDFQKIISEKNTVIEQTCQGISYLMKKNKITTYQATATFVSSNEIQLNNEGNEKISAKNFIIATGSKPVSLPNVPFDKERIISSTETLQLPEIPKHFLVIGAGVIGLELGQVYKQLGAEVTIIEYAENILPIMDKTISKELLKSLKKEGISFHLSTKVEKVSRIGNEVIINATIAGNSLEIKGDYCLVAVGRKPYTENLGLENIGIKTDNRGFISVNEKLQTNLPHIFAIGDVIGGAMLAHKAEEEGVFVAELLAGQKPHINYNAIPAAVYTTPEVAAVGSTEEQLQSQNIPFKVGQFPFKALGRARASAETDGLVKILSHATTDEILGVHIVGARASDLIAQAVTAMEFRASAEDLARICYPHPSFSEAIKEAALDATEKRAIHI